MKPASFPALAAAALLLAAAGCEHSTPVPTAKGQTNVYAMRGEVTALPGAAGADGPIVIHHEPVENFRSNFGDVEPMTSMTMPFQVAKDVSLSGIKVGDKIAFDWAVNWDAQIHEIRSIRVLAPDTVLHFSAAHAATRTGAAPATMPAMPGMPGMQDMPGMSGMPASRP